MVDQDHGYIDVGGGKGAQRARAREGPMIITIVIAEGIKYHVGKGRNYW